MGVRLLMQTALDAEVTDLLDRNATSEASEPGREAAKGVTALVGLAPGRSESHDA